MKGPPGNLNTLAICDTPGGIGTTTGTTSVAVVMGSETGTTTEGVPTGSASVMVVPGGSAGAANASTKLIKSIANASLGRWTILNGVRVKDCGVQECTEKENSLRGRGNDFH